MRKMYGIILLLLLLTGCFGQPKYDVIDKTIETSRIIAKEKAELLITGVSREEIKTALVNHTTDTFHYGAPFHLEVLTKNGYRQLKMKDDIAFIMISYVLQAKETVLDSIDPGLYYDDLPKGKYRLVKALIDKNQALYYAVAEFALP